MGAMSIIGLIDNFIRIIAEDSGLWQFYLMRSIIVCSMIVGYCIYKGCRMRPNRFWVVAIRSLLVSGAIAIYFGSIAMVPIAIAGATLFTSPIFVVVLSIVLLNIRVDIWRILAMVIGFVGVLLILKPTPENFGIFTLLPAFAGVMYALGQLATRHLCANEDTLVLLNGFFLASGLIGIVGLVVLSLIQVPDDLMSQAPFLMTGWVAPTGSFLFWTLVQGVGSLVAVSGLIRGYQIGEPTYVAVFEYSFLAFAGFWAWVFWSEIPDAISSIGIFIIVCAGVVITLRSLRLDNSQ